MRAARTPTAAANAPPARLTFCAAAAVTTAWPEVVGLVGEPVPATVGLEALVGAARVTEADLVGAARVSVGLPSVRLAGGGGGGAAAAEEAEAGDDALSVMGQTVVETAMVMVVTTVLWAGHEVTVGAQLVMVLVVVA